MRFAVYGRLDNKAPTFVVHIFDGCDAPQSARRLVDALSIHAPENEYWMERIAK